MEKNKYIPYLVTGVIITAVSLYFRFLPFMPKSDYQLKKLSKTFVMQKMLQEVKSNVDKSNPALPKEEKAELYKKNLAEIFRKSTKQMNMAIEKNYALLKNMQGSALKDFYLIEADSYYYLGLIKNIIETGKVSGKIKGGRYYNPLMLAPFGGMYYFDLHPYVGFIVYKFMTLFKPDILLERAIAYTSPILTIFVILLFCMIAYFEKIRQIPLLVAGIFFTSAPIFLQRSLYAWFDTDIYNIIFPLVILYLLVQSMYAENILRARFIFITASGLLTGFYTMFWSGWTYIPACVLLGIIFITVFHAFKKDLNLVKENSSIAGAYLASMLGAIILFRGFDGLMFSLQDTYERLHKFTWSNFNIWPDNFITVGELKKISLAKMGVLAGGRIYAALGIINLGIMFFYKKTARRLDNIHNGFILLSFILVPFMMSKGAERFTILLVVPLSITFLFFLDFLYGILVNMKKFAYLKPVGITVMLSTLALPLFSDFIVATRKQPIIYSSVWDGITSFIRSRTPNDAIIGTWWPPGHFITGMGRRQVTFDGATLEKPVGYWISRLFLSNDPREAMGIARMMFLSSNDAVDFLTQKGYSVSNSIEMLNKILPLPQSSAQKYAYGFLTKPDADKLIGMIYGKPRPSYLLVYKDLVDKSMALQFLGNWDFKKAEEFKKAYTINTKMTKKFIEEKADNNLIKIFWGIAGGGPLYQEPESPQLKQEQDKIFFANGIIVDIKTYDVTYAKDVPLIKNNIAYLMYAENGRLANKYFSNSGKLGVMLIKNNGKYSVVLADKRLTGSLLFKLYYYPEIPDEHFKFETRSKSNNPLDTTDLLLYRIVW